MLLKGPKIPVTPGASSYWTELQVFALGYAFGNYQHCCPAAIKINPVLAFPNFP